MTDNRNKLRVNFVRSLRASLLLITVLMALVPAAVIGIIAVNQASKGLQAELQEKLAIAAQVKADRVAQYFNSRSGDVQLFAGMEEIQSLDADTAKPMLKQLFEASGQFETFYLVDKSGKVIVSTDDSAGASIADRDYFADTMAGKAVISEPVISKATGEAVVVVTAPISDDTGVKGFMLGSVSLTKLYKDDLANIDLGSGYTYMLDKTGLIIAHPVADKLLKENAEQNSDKDLVNIAVAMTKGETGFNSYTYGGSARIVAYHPVGINGWSLAAMQPAAEALQTINAFSKMMYIILIVVVIASAVIANFAAQGIAKPVQFLTEAAHEIALGGFLERMDTTRINNALARKDELGLLANSFQTMINSSKEMAQAAERVADYDLTADVTPRSDFDVLGKALAEMVQNLRGAIGSVRQGAQAVSASSVQLSSSGETVTQAITQVAQTVEQVAKGSEQTAQSVNEANRGMEELNRSVDGIASGAQESAGAVGVMSVAAGNVVDSATDIGHRARVAMEAATSGREVAGNGLQAMQATLSGMREIAQTVQSAAASVQEMGQRSQEIGRIVATIEDIAGQTNLLALNAQIEAARAGEQGRGFAVVADEVRKLAERSARATQEISSLIAAVQQGSSVAVSAMAQGDRKVVEGVSLAEQASEVIERLQASVQTIAAEVQQINQAVEQLNGTAKGMMTEVERVSAVVEESSAATEEMAASSGQISESLTAVAAVAEEASASSEEVAASAEEVSAQMQEVQAVAQNLAEEAGRMLKAVQLFRLAEDMQASAVPERAAVAVAGRNGNGKH